MSDALPTTIGRFQVRTVLGRGGFGRVYCAFDPTVGRLVAIKVLTEEGGKDVLHRFRNEAIVAGNLHHENIVTVYEFGEHEGNPFLVMEYLEGEDLHQIIASHKPLTLLQKCSIMSQVAEGLACAHRHGVIHRDVKPANIMVLADGTVKIMDFGIARLTANRDATRLTSQGSVIGTLLYMAPEQFAGAETDALCDIFAYGVLFHELLTGKHPFEGADARTLMYKISFEDPPPIRASVSDCPDVLQNVVFRLLQKDRELRYQSFKEVQRDIEPIRLEFQQQRAAKLLTQAEEQFARKQLEPAQALVLEVLDLDPSNRLARSLWENVQKQLQLRTLQPRIEALLKAGEEHLTVRRFDDAVQSFDGALRLDRSNVHIQGRLDHARGLLEHSKRVAALLEQARQELGKENLTAAHNVISEALRQDPQNTEVATARESIERAIGHRQRERAANEAINKAERLVLLNAYDDAIAILTALGDVSEFAGAQSLLEWIRTEKAAYDRRQRLQSEMVAAAGFLRDQNYAEAVQRLGKLQAEFPENDEVKQLYSYASRELAAHQKAEELARIAAQANALTGSQSFDEALAVLDEALKTYPGEPLLIRLLGDALSSKAAWERKQAVQSTLEQCEELRSKERFVEAIQAAESALRQYGSEPELVELLRQLEMEWEQHRRAEAVRRTFAHVESLLRQAQPEKAVQVVEQALREYPGELKLAELLVRAREEARKLERARAIEAILGKASGYAKAHEFNRALEVLSRGLEAWPGEQAILQQREATEASKRAWEREQAIHEAVRGAQELSSRKQYQDALNLIVSALRRFPGEPVFLELEKQLQREIAEQSKRLAIERAATEASALLDTGRMQDALQLLAPIMKRYPGEPELESVAALAKQRIWEREKAAAIERLLEETRGLASERQFDRALERVSQGLKAYPAEPALVKQQENIVNSKAAWEQEQAIAGIVRRAGQLADGGKFREALQLLSRELQEYRDAPALLELKRQLESRWEQQRREEDIAKVTADGAVMVEQGQLEQACELFGEALLRYPGERRLGKLLAEAEQALQKRERAEAIAKSVREAEWLAKQHRYRAALEMLEQSLKDWGNNGALLALRESVQRDKAAWEYEQAVAKVAQEAENLARKGRFEDALRSIDQALQKFRDHKTLLELRTRLSGEWELQKRAEAVARAASQVRAFLDGGRFEEALRLARESSIQFSGEAVFELFAAQAAKELETRARRAAAARQGEEFLAAGRFEEAVRFLQQAVAEHPGDATLSGQLATARTQLDARKRTEAIEKLAGDARGLAKGHNFDGALTLLDRGLRSWPGDQSLLELQESIRSEKAAWQREQAIRASVRSVTKLVREGRFTEALSAVNAALHNYPDEPGLLELHRQARRGQGLGDASDLLAQGRPADALTLLEKLSPDFQEDADLQALLDRCRQEIQVRERAAAIDELGRSARAKSSAEDFAGALALLDEGQRRWPDERSLVEIRRVVLAEQMAWQRKQALRDAISRCEQLEKQGKLDEARDFFARMVAEFAGEPALPQIEKRLNAALAERERQRRRAVQMEELLSLEKAAPKAQSVSDAAKMLERAQSIVAAYPADEEVLAAGAGVIRHLQDIAKSARELAKGAFDTVLQTARLYLAKHPGHVLFGQFAEQAERGKRVAYLDSLRLAASKEANLEARARMLEEGLKRYPDEPWLRDELGLTRNKLSLVASIVDKARALEGAHKWDEALAQWKSMVSVYRAYPGLDSTIARVEQALQQARHASIERWVQHINKQIEAGDLTNVEETLQRALSEFPGEAALQAAGRRLEEIRAAKKEARALLSQAKSLCGRGEYEEGKAALRRAFELDPDPDFRKLVLSSLTAYAGAALKQGDFKQAEALLGEATSLTPNFTAPLELPPAIAAAKRAEAVRAGVARVTQMRAGGDLRGALLEIERLLTASPEEPQLVKLQQELRKKIQQAKASLMAELRRLNEQIQGAGEIRQLDPLRQRAATIAAENRDDAEVERLASETVRSVDARSRQLKWAPLVGLLKSPRGWIVGGVVFAAVLAATFVAISLMRSGREVAVQINADAPGTNVTAGGKSCITPCTLNLPPGTYTLNANKDGYQAISQPLNLSLSQRQVNLPLALVSLPAALFVNSNFEKGNVRVDGRDAGPLREGQFSVTGLQAGRHTVRVTGGEAEFETEWQVEAGAVPKLVRQMAAKNVEATIVVNAGGTGSIACNCGVRSAAIDGKPAGQTGETPETSTPFQNLTEGAHQITIADRTLVVDVRPNPTLTVFLALDRSVGTLVVETGQDNARVYLNGQVNRRPTEHGLVRILVPVGDYSIRVEKDGYRGPEAQTVSVKKGEEKRITLALAPVPPVLEIAGAMAGSQVKVDGRAVGVTNPSGSLRTEVAPGEHAIELDKDGFGPVRFRAQFNPGRTTRPERGQLAMTAITRAPDPAQVETQDWERIASTESIDQLEDFIRRHPGGAHVEAARNRENQIRQQTQANAANAARQAEQTAWNATDKTKKAALNDYLSRYGNGAHAQDARGLISAIEKQEAETAAAQSQPAPRVPTQRVPAPNDADVAERARVAAEQDIDHALSAFEGAYNRKDINGLTAVWTNLPRDVSDKYREQFRLARTLAFQLRRAGKAIVTGDTASVDCTRSLSLTTRDGQRLPAINERVQVTLARSPSGWLIQSITAR